MATILDSIDLYKPEDLQGKELMDVVIYFYNRGRDNIPQVTPNQFDITRKHRLRSITKMDMLEKNN